MVSVHILFGKVQNPKNKIFDLISWEAWFYLYSDNMLKSHWQKDNKSSENAHILPTRHLKSFEKIQFQVLLYSMNCFNNWKRTVWGGQSEGWIFYFLTGHTSIGKNHTRVYTCLGHFNWKFMSLEENTALQSQKWLQEEP